MACLAVPPLRASSILLLTKGVHQLDFALARLSSKATTVSAAQKIIGSCSSKKHILSLKGNCRCCLMSCARFLHETSSNKGSCQHCTEIVISGYWVGPDADDGWGFVEAVINQMT
ncbi:uncharacterized protein LOC133284899 [Gastrolobium bilobum]|uniref:uncharacterized protein LOC133284899 n=1 Tax=Gastrolobium bilobum TaxID=150636 RepID=UPI002AB09BAB|nr:uncharacterized protein LOC133284899 [Gastrolobium bilobum]